MNRSPSGPTSASCTLGLLQIAIVRLRPEPFSALLRSIRMFFLPLDLGFRGPDINRRKGGEVQRLHSFEVVPGRVWLRSIHGVDGAGQGQRRPGRKGIPQIVSVGLHPISHKDRFFLNLS